MSDVLSVGQIVSKVKYLLESNFRTLSIEGEVTNLSGSSSGHWYFTLSDESSSVSVALFRGDAMRNPLIKTLKDGDKIIITGSLSVYQKRGTFQVIAKKIFHAGKGDLNLKFEQLKAKLAADGLFDPEAKKPIPKLPQKIAVVTAAGAAALQDFLNVFSRRSFSMNVVLVPSLVQGDTAAQSLRKALFQIQKYNLEQTNNDEKFDLIVLTRGGGSLEDLWAFNDEGLAYDIYNCDIPVMSAVGHQVDYSITDFVSDLRCETPTAAAEIVTEYQMSLIQSIKHLQSQLKNTGRNLMPHYQNRLDKSDPKKAILQIQKNIHLLQTQLSRIDFKNRSDSFIGLRELMLNLDDLVARATLGMESQKKNYQVTIEKMGTLVNALGPQNVLQRGFSYVKDSEGKVLSNVKKFKELAPHSPIDIIFYDGKGIVYKNES